VVPCASNPRRRTRRATVLEDKREYVVAIEWDHTVPRDEGLWITGMFANQNSACRLRSQFTIDSVAKAFDLDD
jgi:hypothetical protein